MQVNRIHTKLFFSCFLWATCLTVEAQSLITVLDSVEHQYNVSFAYNADYLANLEWAYPSQNVSLQDLLDQLAREKQLEYQIVNHQKVLIRKSPAVQHYEVQKSIQGKLVDISSGEPLPYAAIYTDDLRYGTTTNEKGEFELDLGMHSSNNLNFQYLGFQPKRVPIENLAHGGTVFLAPSIQMIEPVTIAEQHVAFSIMNPKAVAIHKSFFNNSTSSLLGKDPIAGLKNIAGFMAFDDLSATAGFRGSSADANMYLLDDMPLIHVDHFFGIFSSIQESMVENINLYKNSWPVEFGGRTSALIDIQTAHQDSLTGSLSVNNLTSSIDANIPLGRIGKLLIAGRTTNTDISNTSFFEFLYKNNNTQNSNENRNQLLSIDPSFRFNDYYLKGSFNLGTATSLIIKHYASQDKFDYNYDRIFQVMHDNQRFPVKEQYEESSDWNNHASGLSLNHQWNGTWKSSWLLNSSGYYFNEDINILLTNPLKPKHGLRIPIMNKFSNQVQQIQAQWNNELISNNSYLVKFGYQVNSITAQISLEQDQEELLSNELSTVQHTLFGSISNYTFDEFNWTLGGRLTYDEFAEKILVSPRIQASYNFNDHTQFKSSIAYYEQTLRQTYYEDRFNRGRSFWVLANDNIPTLSTINSMIGLSYSKNGLGVDAELYYKRLKGITEFALAFPVIPSGTVGSEPIKPQLQLYDGSGTSFGLDLTFSYEHQYFQSQLAYSLSKAEQTISELNNGIPYASQDDRRHQIKFLNTFSLGNWSLYTNFIYASGKPYLDLTTGEFLTTNRRNIPFDKFIKNLNAYRRVDIGVDYQFNISRTVRGELGFSVFNALNHDNEAYRQNVYSIKGTDRSAVFGNSIQMLGATPSLQFKLKF